MHIRYPEPPVSTRVHARRPDPASPDAGLDPASTAPNCRPHPSPRIFRGLRYGLILDFAIVAVVVGAWYGVGFLANHLPDVMLGVCIILLGILFGALLAARA